METLIRRLSAADVPYLQEEPLSKHTSFRIGGPAELMAFPRTEAELSVALRAAAEAEITPVLLGAGTNVLAPDEGKRGLIICTRDCLVGMERLDETSISVMAGVPMARAALFARDQGLGGMEFAHGIPGTVGGGKGIQQTCRLRREHRRRHGERRTGDHRNDPEPGLRDLGHRARTGGQATVSTHKRRKEQ